LASHEIANSVGKPSRCATANGLNYLMDEPRQAAGEDVRVTADTLSVELSDGRTITAPLAWFPRLLHGPARERNRWRFIGRGEGIHWPDLDEDISIEGLVQGKPSGESQQSFARWLARRRGKPGKK
jgi:hypothetical protein